MRTEDLIANLAAEAGTSSRPGAVAVLAPIALGAACALVLFATELGVRANAVVSLASPRFVFKFVVAGMLLVTAGSLIPRLVRPGALPDGLPLRLLVAPALLALAVFVELAATPRAAWWSATIGSNALLCSVFIPAMALAPTAALIAVMRRFAPTRPALAGAVAGLTGAGFSALLYAAHCPDDSPLFLGVWYVLATMISTVAAMVAGRRWLTW